MTKEWQKEKYADKLYGRSLVVTTMVGRLTDLDSCQEEAGTRLMLHTAHAARSKFVAVINVSEDTAILVLCFPFQKSYSVLHVH